MARHKVHSDNQRDVEDANGKLGKNSIKIVNKFNKSSLNVSENTSENITGTLKLPVEYLNDRNTNSLFLFQLPI